MKKTNHLRAFALLVNLFLAGNAMAQLDHIRFGEFYRHEQANKELGAPSKKDKRVVLVGNSITDSWTSRSPGFFPSHPYIINRGINGQTSFQFLQRFRQDVIDLQPKVVVINYGTNDIAENTGPYDEDKTYGNVLSMVELARYHKIKVVLTSCLPAEGFWWREIENPMEKIRHLNARVQEYARQNKIPYVDYFSAMVSEDGCRMRPEYAIDKPGVHPNAEGYKVMENMLLPVIDKLRK